MVADGDLWLQDLGETPGRVWVMPEEQCREKHALDRYLFMRYVPLNLDRTFHHVVTIEHPEIPTLPVFVERKTQGAKA